MKKVINASAGQSLLKVIYMKGTKFPELRSATVKRPSAKQALIDMLDEVVGDFPYVGDGLPNFGLNDDEEFDPDFDDLLNVIKEYNGYGIDRGYDYIFLLEIDGNIYIDNTCPEENY